MKVLFAILISNPPVATFAAASVLLYLLVADQAWELTDPIYSDVISGIID